MPAAGLLKRCFAGSETARRKIETARSVGTGLQTAVRTESEIEIEETGLTVATGRELPATAAVPNLMLTRQIAARQLPSGRRTIVSLAWPKVCCLTAELPSPFETVMFGTATSAMSGTVIGIATEIVSGNGTETGIGREKERRIGIEIGIGIVRENGTETTNHGRVVMTHQVIMTENGVTEKRSANASIVAAWNDPPLMSYLMATIDRLPPAAAELKKMMTSTDATLEIQRQDTTSRSRLGKNQC